MAFAKTLLHASLRIFKSGPVDVPTDPTNLNTLRCIQYITTQSKQTIFITTFWGGFVCIVQCVGVLPENPKYLWHFLPILSDFLCCLVSCGVIISNCDTLSLDRYLRFYRCLHINILLDSIMKSLLTFLHFVFAFLLYFFSRLVFSFFYIDLVSSFNFNCRFRLPWVIRSIPLGDTHFNVVSMTSGAMTAWPMIQV